MNELSDGAPIFEFSDAYYLEGSYEHLRSNLSGNFRLLSAIACMNAHTHAHIDVIQKTLNRNKSFQQSKIGKKR